LQRWDKDSNGQIDKDEFQSAMGASGHNLTNQDVTAAFLELDKNNDGVLDFDEFLVLFERAEEDELGAWEMHLSPTRRVK